AGALLGRQVLLVRALELPRVDDEAFLGGGEVQGPQAGERVGAAAAAQEHHPLAVGGDGEAAWGAEGEAPGAGLPAREAVGHGGSVWPAAPVSPRRARPRRRSPGARWSARGCSSRARRPAAR